MFLETENYYHFLRLYEKYIDPVTETFAWCLMKNHFHLLVYVKKIEEIDVDKLYYSTVDKPKQLSPSKQFSNLFNAYTMAVNKRYKRTGSLFEKNFRRKEVASEAYFQKLIFYIHNNPVHHGFVDHVLAYPWTSYGSVVSERPTKIQRKRVVELYGDVDDFMDFHNQKQHLKEIESLLIE